MPLLFNVFPTNSTLADATYLLKTDKPSEKSGSESEVFSGVESSSGVDYLFALCARPIAPVNNYYDVTPVKKSSNEMAVPDNDLYESLAVCGALVEKARVDTRIPDIRQTRGYVQEFVRHQHPQGLFGLISLDADNQRSVPFEVSIVDTAHNDMVSFIVIVVSTECSSHNEEVTGRCFSQEGRTIIIVVSIMSAVRAYFIILLSVNWMRSGESSQIPWAISSQCVSFIDFNYHGCSGYL